MLDLQAERLPFARDDLKIQPFDDKADGQKTWLLHDPIRQQFFQLSEKALELLPFIKGDSAAVSAQKASRHLQREITPEALQDFGQFLRQNELVLADADQQAQFFQKQQAKPTGLSWLLQHYLFIKIPLVNPDVWLTRNLDKVRWMGTRQCLYGLWVIFALGLWLTLRQWDQVMADLPELKSTSGMVSLGLALVLIKIAHELGHAFVSKAKGGQVPALGVAFVVGWPVLYTNTSDAWRFAKPPERVQIDLAGVLVELGIAVVALLLWHLLPDGLLRNLCFWWASTTWIMSVLVNFNPLMRFDGYYLLSDGWQEINLDRRSQALARWQLREWLFGWGAAPPEPPQTRLIVFAFVVWIYRLFLYLGIALLVYHFFIKLLGIVLFVVEIWVFIMRPFVNEVRQWLKNPEGLRWNANTVRTSLVVLGLLGIAFIPWQSQQVLPAYLSYPTQQLMAPFGGRVDFSAQVHQEVDSGEAIVRVVSPRLEHDYQQSRQRVQTLGWKLSVTGLNHQLLMDKPLMRANWQAWQRRQEALFAQKQSGQLVANRPAKVFAINPNLVNHGWVSQGEWLATLQFNDETPRLTAWVKEDQVLHLNLGQSASFFAIKPLDRQKIHARLVDISRQAIGQVEPLAMAKHYGGFIPTKVTQANPEDGIPSQSWYRLSLEPTEDSDITQWQTLAVTPRIGHLSLNTQAQSFIQRMWRIVIGVWRRESGF